LTASLTNTTTLLSDFAVILEFVVGGIVLFAVAPRVIRWFKAIGR
jgi:hypothetical protein